MKITNSMIQGVADIFTASKARRDAEYADFLAFYKNIVENTSAEVAKAIGNGSEFAVDGDSKGSRGMFITMTVVGYLQWKQAIADGLRFQKSTVEQVKTAMLMALAKAAETNKLTAEERKALLAVLDQ